MRGSVATLAVCLGLFVSGCGGGKPAESVDDASADEGDAKAADAPQANDGEAEDGKANEGKSESTKASKADDPKDEPPKATRTAEDIITAPDVLFLFSFNDSEPKRVAEEKCAKKVGDDAKKMNECMAAARKGFPADGHRFKKDEKDQLVWITVRQKGNRLTALHKIPVEVVEQTATSVTLKPIGKDTGSAPMKPPATVVFEVPNDYQIAIADPKHGRLVFQAKVGVVTE